MLLKKFGVEEGPPRRGRLGALRELNEVFQALWNSGCYASAGRGLLPSATQTRYA